MATPTPIERLEHALGEAAGAPVTLERPRDPAHGDYATNVALQVAGQRGRPPLELAEELAASAADLPEVASASAAAPGFVNLTLAPAVFGELLEEMLQAGRDYGGGSEASRAQRIQVEMVSANPTGPITVASGRNGAYGDSIARLLEFAGHQVEREYYYNDAGGQMDRFRASVEARRGGRSLPRRGTRARTSRIWPERTGTRSPPRSQESRRRSNASASTSTAGRSRVSSSRGYRRSWSASTRTRRTALCGSGRLPTATKRTVSSSARLSEADSRRTRRPTSPTCKTSSSADSTASSTCSAPTTTVSRGWYAVVAKMLGYDPAAVEVLLYQLVHLTKGGEQTKMSKRRGDVVFLDEFMDEVGVDAARWYLVPATPSRRSRSTSTSPREKTQKNPVYYVQYAHARIAGILRNAEGAAESRRAAGRARPARRRSS